MNRPSLQSTIAFAGVIFIVAVFVLIAVSGCAPVRLDFNSL